MDRFQRSSAGIARSRLPRTQSDADPPSKVLDCSTLNQLPIRRSQYDRSVGSRRVLEAGFRANVTASAARSIVSGLGRLRARGVHNILVPGGAAVTVPRIKFQRNGSLDRKAGAQRLRIRRSPLTWIQAKIKHTAYSDDLRHLRRGVLTTSFSSPAPAFAVPSFMDTLIHEAK